MWTHGVYSIYDSKANLWLPPFFARNSAVATRMFEQACNQEASEFKKFATDYSLHEIGQWNENEGEILGSVPKSLGLAAAFVKKLEVV